MTGQQSLDIYPCHGLSIQEKKTRHEKQVRDHGGTHFRQSGSEHTVYSRQHRHAGSFFSLMEVRISRLDTDTVEVIYPAGDNYAVLFGTGDRNIKTIERRYDVSIVCREGGVKISGETTAVKKAARILSELDGLLSSGTQIDETHVAVRARLS